MANKLLCTKKETTTKAIVNIYKLHAVELGEQAGNRSKTVIIDLYFCSAWCSCSIAKPHVIGYLRCLDAHCRIGVTGFAVIYQFTTRTSCFVPRLSRSGVLVMPLTLGDFSISPARFIVVPRRKVNIDITQTQPRQR